MILPKTTTIYDKGAEVVDSEGMSYYPWDQNLGTVRCDLQPIGGDRAQREYGITEKVTNRMFCEVSPLVAAGRRAIIDSVTYDIVYVAAWDRHMEVLLNKR